MSYLDCIALIHHGSSIMQNCAYLAVSSWVRETLLNRREIDRMQSQKISPPLSTTMSTELVPFGLQSVQGVLFAILHRCLLEEM